MKLRGFTLIELIVVVGIIAQLATITLLAINPGKLFAQARNARRQTDVQTLSDALNHYGIDNGGIVPTAIPLIPKQIGTGTGNVNLSSMIVPKFLADIPFDPQKGDAQNSLYYVCQSEKGQIGVWAKKAELGQFIGFGECVRSSDELELNGTSQYINMGTNNILAGQNAMTAEAWIKPNVGAGDYDFRTIVGKLGGCDESWDIGMFNGWLYFGVSTSRGAYYDKRAEADRRYVMGEWNHVAGVYDGHDLRLYLNGQLVGSETLTGIVAQGGCPATIGANMDRYGSGDPVNFYSGSIDEVRISNVARYTSNFVPDYILDEDANTVGMWHLDKISLGISAPDSSGYNNNGTIVNAPEWGRRKW